MIKRKSGSLKNYAAVILLGLCVNSVWAADSKSSGKTFVKWVDEKGVTHYGDSIPPQYSNRDNSVINSQGRIIKQNQPTNINAQQKPDISKEMVEQQRRDRALRAAYQSEQDIDAARDRALQIDQITLQTLQQNRTSAEGRLQANQKAAAGYSQRKKPVPEDLTQDIKNNQLEIAKIDANVKLTNGRMDATKQKYEGDRQRFRELTQQDSASTAPPNK